MRMIVVCQRVPARGHYQPCTEQVGAVPAEQRQEGTDSFGQQQAKQVRERTDDEGTCNAMAAGVTNPKF